MSKLEAYPGTLGHSCSVELGALRAWSSLQYFDVFPCGTQACVATENRRNFSRLKIDVIWVQAEFGAKVGDLSLFNQRRWLMLSKIPLSE